jgi:hypothetical protein
VERVGNDPNDKRLFDACPVASPLGSFPSYFSLLFLLF